jgi:hypothetical protein
MDQNKPLEVNSLSNNTLKTIAAYCIYESDLEKNQKLSLLNFIEHVANRKQITDMIIMQEANLLVTSIIIASALAAGNKAYYKIYSNSTQACREQEDKKSCLKQYKLNALSAKRNEVRKHVSKCTQTIKPEQCQKTFANTIKKIEKQIITSRLE